MVVLICAGLYQNMLLVYSKAHCGTCIVPLLVPLCTSICFAGKADWCSIVYVLLKVKLLTYLSHVSGDVTFVSSIKGCCSIFGTGIFSIGTSIVEEEFSQPSKHSELL